MLSSCCVGAAARRVGLSPLSSVMPLYLAGQCAFFCTHLPPWIRGTRRIFPEFLWIPDLSPLTIISSERDPTVQEVRPLKKYFLGDIEPRRCPGQKLFLDALASHGAGYRGHVIEKKGRKRKGKGKGGNERAKRKRKALRKPSLKLGQGHGQGTDRCTNSSNGCW